MQPRLISRVLVPILLAMGACNNEKEPGNVFGKSSLAKALDKWTEQGGDLDDVLSSNGDHPVKSKAEAYALFAALDALREDPGRAGRDAIGSPLHALVGFFQHVESKEAFEVLRQEGLPRLRMWVSDHLDGRDVKEDDVMFIMKILAMYRQREDVDLIAKAARKPVDPNGFMWSIIFGQFDAGHPHAGDMIDALRSPLPSEFILVAYLDMATGMAIAGKLDRHPFDSQAGQRHLEAWLRDANEEHFSYAHSATAALPLVDQSSRERLLQVADDHPDTTVRMEAAWAQAEIGNSSGLERLTDFCRDPRYSRNAQQYLEELGRGDLVPAKSRNPEFQAIAEMADWLAHPHEFGRPPDNIELFDSRELFWPPTNDHRRLFLIMYSYNDDDGGEPENGVGMVGSVTFALFGEATADLSPEDVYGLHCCWELEYIEDSRAPKKRTAKAGREILGSHNDGF